MDMIHSTVISGYIGDMLIVLELSMEKNQLTRKIITADVGGTNGRFAIADVTYCNVPSIVDQKTYHYAAFENLATMLQLFLEEHQAEDIQCARLAVAGQTTFREGSVTNIGWHLVSNELEARSGLRDITLMNDFAAVAHSIAHMRAGSFKSLKTGVSDMSAPISVMGPGTGFGFAQVIQIDGTHHVVATESGHIAFAQAHTWNMTYGLILEKHVTMFV